jgi:integrase
MSIMASPHKHPKSGIYYFRMAVPKLLISVIGKTSFKSSLQIKNLTEAKQRFGKYLEDAHKQIELAKLKLLGTSNTILNARDCAIIAERWYEHAKAEVDASGDYNSILNYEHNADGDGHVHEFGLSDTFSISGSAIKTATEAQLQELSEDLKDPITGQLDRDGLVVSVNSDSFRRLAVAFYHYVYRIESLCRGRHKHDFGYNPVKTSIANDPLSVTKVVTKLPSTRSPLNSILSLFERYRKSEALKEKGAKGCDEVGLQITRLIEIIGDIDVTEVTRGHIVVYRDTLLQLPKSKTNEIRSKSVAEQMEIANNNSLETLSSTTVKNSIRAVSRVFSYVVEVGLIDVSPVKGVNVAVAKMTEVGEGRGYSDADLNKLFQLDVFKNDKANKRYGMACYWIPILCRYTGARLNEIAQLHKSDIAKSVVNGSGREIYYLNIRRGEGQSVKSNSSLRHIPIPDHIIELGFLDYVEQSGDVLFPDIIEDKYGKKAPALSKWWSQMVKKAGVTSSQPAHAFRHSFKTSMRMLGVEDSVSDAITGHTAKNVGGSYGTVPLETKKMALDRLPRLALTKLKANGSIT